MSCFGSECRAKHEMSSARMSRIADHGLIFALLLNCEEVLHCDKNVEKCPLMRHFVTTVKSCVGPCHPASKLLLECNPAQNRLPLARAGRVCGFRHG